MRLAIRWVVNAGLIVLVAYLLPAVQLSSVAAALAMGSVLSTLSTLVRPIFKLFALPLNVATLGLFTLVLNAAFIEILDWILQSFAIRGFRWSIVLAVVVSVITIVVNIVVGGPAAKRPARR